MKKVILILVFLSAFSAKCFGWQTQHFSDPTSSTICVSAGNYTLEVESLPSGYIWEWYLVGWGGYTRVAGTSGGLMWNNAAKYTVSFSGGKKTIECVAYKGSDKKTFRWILDNTGKVNVSISPSGARSAGAKWRLSGGPDTNWKTSGITISEVPEGSYTVYFNSISGWTSPSSQSITVSRGSTKSVSVSYSQQTGSVRTTIEPSSARSAGARWRLTSGSDTNWKTSGTTVSGIPVGSYTVAYNTLPGWNSPSNDSVTVSNGNTSSASGTYSLQTGSVRTTIEPSEARSAGARWRLTSGPNTNWQTSGTTISNIPVGDYTVIYNDLNGWDMPSDDSVSVGNGTTSTESGNYVKQEASVTVTVKDQNGNGKNGAIVLRYDSDGTGSSKTTLNSIVSWSGLELGNHRFEAYFEGANPFDTDGELWAYTTKSLRIGSNALTLQRNLPYVSQLQIVRVNDGQVVPIGGVVHTDEEFRIKATVANPSGENRTVRITFWGDRNKDASLDVSALTQTNVDAQSSISVFSEPKSVSGLGQYYTAVMTQIQKSDLSWGIKTDAWAWDANPRFQIVTAPPPIPVQIWQTSGGASDVGVEWEAVIDPDGDSVLYDIQYRETGTTTWTTRAIGRSLSAITITGLSSSTEYDVRVRAYDSIGGVDHSLGWIEEVALFETDFVEQVDTPPAPVVSNSGTIYEGDLVQFALAPYASNYGSCLEARFDFDSDGIADTDWSDIDLAVDASTSFSGAGIYSVRAQTRVASDTSVISDWSNAHNVVVVSKSSDIDDPVLVAILYDEKGEDFGLWVTLCEDRSAVRIDSWGFPETVEQFMLTADPYDQNDIITKNCYESSSLPSLVASIMGQYRRVYAAPYEGKRVENDDGSFYYVPETYWYSGLWEVEWKVDMNRKIGYKEAIRQALSLNGFPNDLASISVSGDVEVILPALPASLNALLFSMFDECVALLEEKGYDFSTVTGFTEEAARIGSDCHIDFILSAIGKTIERLGEEDMKKKFGAYKHYKKIKTAADFVKALGDYNVILSVEQRFGSEMLLREYLRTSTEASNRLEVIQEAYQYYSTHIETGDVALKNALAELTNEVNSQMSFIESQMWAIFNATISDTTITAAFDALMESPLGKSFVARVAIRASNSPNANFKGLFGSKAKIGVWIDLVKDGIDRYQQDIGVRKRLSTFMTIHRMMVAYNRSLDPEGIGQNVYSSCVQHRNQVNLLMTYMAYTLDMTMLENFEFTSDDWLGNAFDIGMGLVSFNATASISVVMPIANTGLDFINEIVSWKEDEALDDLKVDAARRLDYLRNALERRSYYDDFVLARYLASGGEDMLIPPEAPPFSVRFIEDVQMEPGFFSQVYLVAENTVDGEEISFESDNSWVTIQKIDDVSSYGVIDIPETAPAGNYPVIITACSSLDNRNQSTTTFVLYVDVNQSPVFVVPPVPDDAISVGENFVYFPVVFDSDGGGLLFSLQNKPGWLTIDSQTGVVSGTPSSGDVGLRDGIILIVEDDHGLEDELEFSIEVTTDCGDPYIDPIYVDIDYTGGEVPVEVSIGDSCSWSASTSFEWIHLQDETEHFGSSSFTITIDLNSQQVTREGTVLFGTVEFPVYQAGAPVFLIVAPSELSLNSDPSSSSLVVDSNVYWTVDVDQEWIHVTPSSGFGDDELEVNLDASYEEGSRSGQITVTGGGISQFITVSQAACDILNPTANAGSDIEVADTDNNGSESVTLNGSLSSDADGEIVSWSWTWSGGSASGETVDQSFDVGTTTVTLTVTDDDGATDTDTIVVTVAEQQYTVLFSDDFSNGLDQWTLWGSPRPVVNSSLGNPAPSFNNNGDGTWDSGAITKQAFDFSNGLVIEADAYQEEFDLWESFVIGLAQYTSYSSSTGCSSSVWVRSCHDNGDVTQFMVRYSATEVETYEFDDADVTWRSYKIVIRPDLRVEFYKKGELLYTSTHSLSLEFNNMPLLIGGRATSTVLVDNIKVSQYEASRLDLVASDFSDVSIDRYARISADLPSPLPSEISLGLTIQEVTGLFTEYGGEYSIQFHDDEGIIAQLRFYADTDHGSTEGTIGDISALLRDTSEDTPILPAGIPEGTRFDMLFFIQDDLLNVIISDHAMDAELASIDLPAIGIESANKIIVQIHDNEGLDLPVFYGDCWSLRSKRTGVDTTGWVHGVNVLIQKELEVENYSVQGSSLSLSFQVVKGEYSSFTLMRSYDLVHWEVDTDATITSDGDQAYHIEASVPASQPRAFYKIVAGSDAE